MKKQAQTGRPGPTRKQKQIIDPDLLYATVDKTRDTLVMVCIRSKEKNFSAVIITILGVAATGLFVNANF